jgi:hypothetical protein
MAGLLVRAAGMFATMYSTQAILPRLVRRLAVRAAGMVASAVRRSHDRARLDESATPLFETLG